MVNMTLKLLSTTIELESQELHTHWTVEIVKSSVPETVCRGTELTQKPYTPFCLLVRNHEE